MSTNGRLWRHVRIGFVVCGWMILAGLWLAGAVLLLGLRSWPYELLHHFVLHYFLLSNFLVIAFLLLRRKIAASCSAVLLTVFAVFLWGVYGDSESSVHWAETSPNYRPDRHQLLTVITHNVRDTNKRHRELRSWLRSNPADVVVLQEVPSREAALYREERVFTHQLEMYDPTLNHPNFPDDKAIMVLSKYPFTVKQKFKPFHRSRPIAIVRVSVPNAKDPWIVVVDAWDPKTTASLANRDQLFIGIARKISELRGPIIVAGDFNATPFTPVFKDFLRLANVSLLQSPVSTYPAILGWLGIPIDHFLVRDVQLTDVEALFSIGSDHRPLKATLMLPGQILN
jgi:endonuclease/exonuclease/phosphatase (EEP) superfamily protein YafD